MESAPAIQIAPTPTVLFVTDPALDAPRGTIWQRFRSAVNVREIPDGPGLFDPGQPLCREALEEVDGLLLARGNGAETESAVDPGDAAQATVTTEHVSEHLPSLHFPRTSWTEDEETAEQFLDEVYGHAQIRRLFAGDWRLDAIVAFNLRERYRIIVHDPKRHKLMGRIVAKAKDHPRDRLREDITSLFLESLRKPTTRRKHLNVMETVREFLEPRIAATENEKLKNVLAEYKAGRVPRREPLVVLQALVRSSGIAGLASQSYLFPDDPIWRFLESASVDGSAT